jgi:hypothetical protein
MYLKILIVIVSTTNNGYEIMKEYIHKYLILLTFILILLSSFIVFSLQLPAWIGSFILCIAIFSVIGLMNSIKKKQEGKGDADRF